MTADFHPADFPPNEFPRGVPGRDDRHAPLGTARWSFDAPEWHPGYFFLGKTFAGQEAGYRDDRHIVTVAGSRAGKGYTCIVPNLRRWPGSCVVLDPKGENATLTAAIRAEIAGHSVAVLDPHGAADLPDSLRVSFNPLDLIDAESDDAIDLAAAIGDAIMIGSGDGKDVHWTESGRQIFEGVLLHVAATETGERRSLVRVRQLLTQGDREAAERLNADLGDEPPYSSFDALWHVMANSEAAHEAVRDVIAGAARSITDMGENERGSVLSTARRNTKFIDSPWMRRCLQGSGHGLALDIDRLKSDPGGLTLFVCLPARFLPTHARFMRLVLNLIFYRMEAQGLTQPACGHPVLMVLDEAAALGRMEAVEKAAGLMAGFGVKLWTILQDLGQLKRHYKESWETFLGNAGILQFFANSDMTTLEWLSKRLGETELIRETNSRSTSSSSNISRSQSRTEQSGWSNSAGLSSGTSDMAELQRLSSRDGGGGLVPALARFGASGTGHSQGHTSQEGRSGGESLQQGDSSSSGSGMSDTLAEGIHRTALMTPDEVARLFDRDTMRQIVLISGMASALRRTE
jgi:type IV secretion system protein VirD4